MLLRRRIQRFYENIRQKEGPSPEEKLTDYVNQKNRDIGKQDSESKKNILGDENERTVVSRDVNINSSDFGNSWDSCCAACWNRKRN